MKSVFLIVIILSAPNIFAADFEGICKGKDESIVATDKQSNKMIGAYICSKHLKSKPIAIVKDENGDGTFDKNDSIAYYISKDFIFFQSFLERKIDSFTESLEEEFRRTGKNWTYYQLDIEDLLEISGINDIQDQLTDLINEEDGSYYDDDYAEEVIIEELYRQRYYNPGTTRFLTEDPKGFAGGHLNLYNYVGNNPILRTDPLGLDYRVCSRPLKGLPSMAGDVRHDYIVFDNGDVISYGPSGDILGSLGQLNHDEDPNAPKNSCGATQKASSSKEMRMKNWALQNQNQTYNVLNYNCQDFVQDAIHY